MPRDFKSLTIEFLRASSFILFASLPIAPADLTIPEDGIGEWRTTADLVGFAPKQVLKVDSNLLVWADAMAKVEVSPGQASLRVPFLLPAPFLLLFQ